LSTGPLPSAASRFAPRFYRHWVKDNDLLSFSVAEKETDLCVRAKRNLRAKALKSLLKHRASLEAFVARNPLFLTTLDPYWVEEDAPGIVRDMAKASQVAGVGPMAAVAGAIAEAVGKDLLSFSSELIVENGGDIFLRVTRTRLVGVYAGRSPFTGRIALEILPKDTPLGIGTSSGTIGHSLSLGCADAAIALSRSAAVADAAATALGNAVRCAEDVPVAIEVARGLQGVLGVAIIVGDRIGVWGRVKIVSLGGG